jgi:hypothetical protein
LILFECRLAMCSLTLAECEHWGGCLTVPGSYRDLTFEFFILSNPNIISQSSMLATYLTTEWTVLLENYAHTRAHTNK